MVYEALRNLLILRCGCEEEDVCMAASLDDLNVFDHERTDLMLALEELFGVSAETEDIRGFETVDDMVSFIEDRM